MPARCAICDPDILTDARIRDDGEAFFTGARSRGHRAMRVSVVPLSEANHMRFGVSTTPTLVLVDRAGIIRLYHPGRMPMEQLEPRVRALLDAPTF